MALEMDIVVEHPDFGRGEIDEVDLETGDQLISVRWENGQIGTYKADELDFIPVYRQSGVLYPDIENFNKIRKTNG